MADVPYAQDYRPSRRPDSQRCSATAHGPRPYRPVTGTNGPVRRSRRPASETPLMPSWLGWVAALAVLLLWWLFA